MAVPSPIQHLVTVSSSDTLVLNYEYIDNQIKCVFFYFLFFHFDFKLLGIMLVVRVFIRHRRSENSPFSTKNSPASVQ